MHHTYRTRKNYCNNKTTTTATSEEDYCNKNEEEELAKNHRLMQHQLKSNATPEETSCNTAPHPLDPEGGGGGGAGGGERGGRRA
jgi:hypothetical protein